MSFDRRRFFTEFIDDFYAESDEHLGNIRRQLLALESGEPSGNAVIFDELLRSFHTLKGLSSMVGCAEIEQVAHHTEEYLRLLKAGRTSTSSEGTEILIEVAETLESAVAALRSNQPSPDITPVVTRLAALALPERDEAETASRAVEIAPAGVAWKFQFRPSQELSERGINVAIVRDRLQGLGQITRVSPHVGGAGEVLFEFHVNTSADEQSFPESVGKDVVWSRVEEEAAAAAAGEPMRFSSDDLSQPQTVVRVEMTRLDELMRIVGELVTQRWRLEENLKPFERQMPQADWRKVQETSSAIERELRSLREAVIRVRMVPVGQVFERMRFVAYALERETDKKIRLVLSGEDTEVDKIVVERMMEPLLHMVRNAISHGIESRAERTAAGKPVEGTIRLRASTVGESVVIEIEDDGAGIDAEAVMRRGRSVGVVGPDAPVDDGSLLSVLCSPGFSTRETADLASGRGVGMAVVSRTVTELGGMLSLQTTRGEGTLFRIKLPLTLAIADALIVSVGGHRFALPQVAIEEVMRIESPAVVKAGNGELVPHRGATLPFVRLSRLFGLKQDRQDAFHVLVVNRNGNSVGLAVDRVLYHREIVIRSINDPLMRVPGFSGATEVGDGRPVLIIDPTALLNEVVASSGRSA